MENLRLERSRLPRHVQDSRSESSDDDSIRGGVRRPRRRSPGARNESFHRQNEMMKARQEVLEENNRELEQQLEQLKEIMRRVSTPCLFYWATPFEFPEMPIFRFKSEIRFSYAQIWPLSLIFRLLETILSNFTHFFRFLFFAELSGISEFHTPPVEDLRNISF